jgi:hypothetical protein
VIGYYGPENRLRLAGCAKEHGRWVFGVIATLLPLANLYSMVFKPD